MAVVINKSPVKVIIVSRSTKDGKLVTGSLRITARAIEAAKRHTGRKFFLRAERLLR
jgi:hypothetical protein